MPDTVDKRLEIVQSRIDQYGMRFPVAMIADKIKLDRGYISSVLNGKKPMSDNFWSKFDSAFPDKSVEKLTDQTTAAAPADLRARPNSHPNQMAGRLGGEIPGCQSRKGTAVIRDRKKP